MSSYLVAYLVTFLTFTVLDICWLTFVGAALYRQALGTMLLTDVKMAPAVVFYLLYPVGLVIFSVAPALKASSVVHALMYGALFGIFTYATYDLTNYATLRNWTAQITIIDIVYGGVMGAVASAVGYAVATWATG